MMKTGRGWHGLQPVTSCARHSQDGGNKLGSLYQRGTIWWVKYYRNGRPIRESSHSAKKIIARKLLERRKGKISLGLTPGSIFSKVNFNEFAEGLLRDYRINHKKSLKRADLSIRTLKRHFSGMKAIQITTPVIKKYILQRVDDGVANSSIKRELAAMSGKAFSSTGSLPL